MRHIQNLVSSLPDHFGIGVKITSKIIFLLLPSGLSCLRFRVLFGFAWWIRAHISVAVCLIVSAVRLLQTEMEVVAGDLPFQRRNVVEWSHRDRLTGALERARRETNHWSASTASAVHNFGQVGGG